MADKKQIKPVFALVSVLSMCAIPASADQKDAVPPSEPVWQMHKVTAGELKAARKAGKSVFEHLFGRQAENVARFNRLDARFVRAGRSLKVPALPEGAVYTPMPSSYAPAATEPKHIVVDLQRQFLGAYEDGRLVASYPISSGDREHPTPAGRYKVTRKDATHKSSIYPEPHGGWPMPWALRFRSTFYWIHAGDLVGGPVSHGCVRLFAKDARALFDWADVGTPVHVVKRID